MADLKMPEINYVIVAGNLTKDPIFRQTNNKTPVVNFSVASNRRYKLEIPFVVFCSICRAHF